MKNYDIIIVGGGIAGIYTMYNLKKRNPKLKVLLLEKEDRFGGRVYTYTKKRCLKKIKGFTMRSSCAPYKYCKK
jgi:protoporphyrinogen oxidase